MVLPSSYTTPAITATPVQYAAPAVTTQRAPPQGVPYAGNPSPYNPNPQPVTCTPTQWGGGQQWGRGQGGGRNQGGRRRSSGRGSRGGANGRNSVAYANTPPQDNPAGGGVQYQQGEGTQYQQGGGRNTAPNLYKTRNNWNVCFSCGWDVPAWHTSATCPPMCRRVGHWEDCTRDNAQEMKDSGLNVCMKKLHKKYLPLVPRPGHE